MTTTLQRPPSTLPVADLAHAAHDVAELDEQSLLTHIAPRSETIDRAAERHRRAKQLAALADSDRERLEELRAQFLRRLHRTSSERRCQSL